MKTRRLLSITLALLMLFGLMTGCAQSASQSTTAATTASTTKAEGGEITFTYARPEEFSIWDPLDNNAIVNSIHNHLVYDCLLAKGENFEMLPCLAKSWEFSTDGKTITFKLQEGVKFHNGSDFNAKDVKITFDRLLVPDCALTQKANFSALESIDVVDDYTVVFHLNKADAYILTMLAQKPIIDGELYEKEGPACFDKNIGTGPWKFVEWKQGVHTEYVRNDDYWAGVTTNVDRLYYVPLNEDTTRVSALRTGDVDAIDSVPFDNVATLKGEGLSVKEIMSTDQLYMGFQFKDSVMADKNVRLAVTHAIDRESMAKDILGSGRAATFPTGEGGLGFDENYPVVEYDEAKAKQYLADSSYNGETIRVIGPTSNYEKIGECMTAIFHYLTAAGFKVDMKQMESAAFSDARKSGQYDIYVVGASFSGGDGYGFINQRIVGDSLASHYGNEELNNMILNSNIQMKEEDRAVAMKALYTKMMDDVAPMAFLIQYQYNYACKSNVSGIYFYPDKSPDLSRVKIG